MSTCNRTCNRSFDFSILDTKELKTKQGPQEKQAPVLPWVCSSAPPLLEVGTLRSDSSPVQCKPQYQAYGSILRLMKICVLSSWRARIRSKVTTVLWLPPGFSPTTASSLQPSPRGACDSCCSSLLFKVLTNSPCPGLVKVRIRSVNGSISFIPSQGTIRSV